MDDTNEKYPVCVSRNTRAALRRFLQPLSLLALLRARRTPWPAALLVPVRVAPRRKPRRE
jgi:hypothetical protein